MISSVKLIPVTENSVPFTSAVKLCDLPQNGYVEEEYFFDGTANVYERTEDGGKRVRFSDAPYTSRFLLRRPADRERFSGNIIIEIMNSTPGHDLDRSWIITRKQIIRGGDVYIGLLSKPNVFAPMMKADPERYAPLKWPNPDPDSEKNISAAALTWQASPETENGLYWDMLMDTARLVRSEDPMNPMSDFIKGKDVKVILMGWSQSGGYMIRYMLDFADKEGKDCFDGYFSMGSAAVATPNLNQSEQTPPLEQNLRIAQPDRPFIDMHTESENASFGTDMTKLENGPFYRAYDIAGPSHDTTYSEEEYYAKDNYLKKVGLDMAYGGIDEYPNSFPYQFPYQAALVALEKWIRTGKAPMTVEPIQVDENLKNVKDSDGNSIGGWRIPQIDYPVCAYYGTSTAAKNPEDTLTAFVYGHEVPFTPEEIKKRYTDLTTYRKLITEKTDECIEKGLILEADREEAIERAVAKAAAYGL